jgi:hypothetical protein
MAEFSVSLKDLAEARRLFEQNEPRDLFYRAATELVGLALRRALAVLLQTWNKARYQYKKFDAAHFADIDALLSRYRRELARLRRKSLEHLPDREKPGVVQLFESFEAVLGPVGAAKALHLLAPRLFPIWDRTIAEKYGVQLAKAGSNGDRYWRFMAITGNQCRRLRSAGKFRGNALKGIDEYNYCKHTKEWLPS